MVSEEGKKVYFATIRQTRRMVRGWVQVGGKYDGKMCKYNLARNQLLSVCHLPREGR